MEIGVIYIIPRMSHQHEKCKECLSPRTSQWRLNPIHLPLLKIPAFTKSNTISNSTVNKIIWKLQMTITLRLYFTMPTACLLRSQRFIRNMERITYQFNNLASALEKASWSAALMALMSFLFRSKPPCKYMTHCLNSSSLYQEHQMSKIRETFTWFQLYIINP